MLIETCSTAVLSAFSSSASLAFFMAYLRFSPGFFFSSTSRSFSADDTLQITFRFSLRSSLSLSPLPLCLMFSFENIHSSLPLTTHVPLQLRFLKTIARLSAHRTLRPHQEDNPPLVAPLGLSCVFCDSRRNCPTTTTNTVVFIDSREGEEKATLATIVCYQM